ncbi:MAG: GGDEF domain-containing protein [Gammaproteobacteria bacterium]|nr:GGDEF domain-containing protein [Gammaproteobacteria bacterium]MDH3411078.1 GGDEF domain-containing protein [Gammaproteobacteria bacterium]
MKIFGTLSSLWSSTDFDGDELTAYAQRLMGEETRHGVMLLSVVCFVLLASTALANIGLDLGELYVYTYAALAVLSLHMYFSAKTTRDVKAHHLLGMTLLVICGAAIVLLAHKTGEFNPLMYATIALLFMVVPAAPWGLREASLVIALVYFIFTVSTLGVASRFGGQTLWALQYFIVSCAAISLVLVVRNVAIRKQDIVIRFDLENVQRQLETLASRDPLTGAWNRRVLEPAFKTLMTRCATESLDSSFCVLDIDHFKRINDRNGHEFGDNVLDAVVQALHQILLPGESLVRMGGDEFVALLIDTDPRERLQQAMAHLRERADLKTNDGPISISGGFKRIAPNAGLRLEAVYQAADRALYVAKKARNSNKIVEHDVSMNALPDTAKGHEFPWRPR